MKPSHSVLETSEAEVAANGKRLLEDAKILFDLDRHGTALALAVLSQEEFAKAFLIRLVVDDALPWLPSVRRSMAQHIYKHLLDLVMEWLSRLDLESVLDQERQSRERHAAKMAWIERNAERYKRGQFAPDPCDPAPVEPDISIPPDVAGALNTYRHEEIERLAGGNPWQIDEWTTELTRKVADGLIDRKKQSAIYVNITKTGEVGLHPGLVNREDAAKEIRKAEGPMRFSDEYRAIVDVVSAMFANFEKGKLG